MLLLTRNSPLTDKLSFLVRAGCCFVCENITLGGFSLAKYRAVNAEKKRCPFIRSPTTAEPRGSVPSCTGSSFVAIVHFRLQQPASNVHFSRLGIQKNARELSHYPTVTHIIIMIIPTHIKSKASKTGKSRHHDDGQMFHTSYFCNSSIVQLNEATHTPYTHVKQSKSTSQCHVRILHQPLRSIMEVFSYWINHTPHTSTISTHHL